MLGEHTSTNWTQRMGYSAGMLASLGTGLAYGSTEAKIAAYGLKGLKATGKQLYKQSSKLCTRSFKPVIVMNGASTITNTTKNAEKYFVKKGTTSKLPNVDKLSQAPKGGVGQIWSATKKNSSVENAFGHWKSHGKEFPYLQNSKAYVEHAYALFKNPNALSRIRPKDGCLLRYEVSSNTFGSYTSEGIPKTLFRPGVSKDLPSRFSNPLEYFYGQ